MNDVLSEVEKLDILIKLIAEKRQALADEEEAIAYQNELEERIDAAVEDASAAFFAKVAKAFPEAVSGDLGVEEQNALGNAMTNAVIDWVAKNV